MASSKTSDYYNTTCHVVDPDTVIVQGMRFVKQRTCKVASRRELDYGNISEVSLWYECGAAILIAKGIEEPRHCPGCGCKVVS